MKVHERRKPLATASNELGAFLLQLQERHALTDVEVQNVLVKAMASVNDDQLHAEWYPVGDPDEVRGDEYDSP